jgi:predicted ATPase/KaiC/GvpD/RAD55 family RecA-like ATPase
MDILKASVDRAISDQGGLVFLYGEAGIGKTRLTKELRAYARSHGMQILYGRCPSLFRMNGVPPYSPWKGVIRDYLQKSTPEQLQRAVGYYPGEIYKIVPEIRQKLITFSESPPLSPEMEHDRLFEAVSQFVENISKETPLVVVFDDLQWADSSSLLLLHYLARGVYRENLLILGAYRDTEVEEKHPLSPVLTELNRARLLQSVQLKRISSDEVTEMIKQILGQNDVPREFCELIYEKTNGNPFFVEEVIASLKEEGVIIREESKYRIREVSEIRFPKTVRDVLKARLERLDDEYQNVLTLASFIGNDFTFEALRAVTGFEESKLLEIIEKMLKTGLLKCRAARGEDMCSFADVLIRDVLYEEVSPLRRKKLHGIVGCALEKAYAKKRDEHFGELASHFLESGEKEKALGYFLKAGEKASQVYANNEAASYYHSALTLLDWKGDAPQEKTSVLETLGDIKSLVGDYDSCLKYWNEALLLREQLGEKEKVARLHRKISNILWIKLGETDKAKEYQAKALEILQILPESVELASLRADIAEMYWHTGDMAAGLPLAEKAVEGAQKLMALEVLARSYLIWGKIVGWGGDWKKTGESSEKALRIALSNGYVEIAVEEYKHLAGLFALAEEQEKSLEFLQKGYELAKKAGAISAQTWISNALARKYINIGNTNAALVLNEESVALDRKTGNQHNLSQSLIALGHTYEILGEWNEAEEYLNEALTTAQKLNHIPAIAFAYFCLGRFHSAKEEHAKAREFFEKSVEAAKKAGIRSGQIDVLYWAIGASIELGELEKAEKQIDVLQMIAQNRKRPLAYANYLRARLFRAQKKWNESIEFFEKRFQELEALNAKRWEVEFYAREFLYEYARVYVERNQEGDKQKALNILNQALEILQKMNARKDIEKVKAQIIYLQIGRKVQLEPVSPVPTGYVFLDRLLGGGLPPNFATALTSPPCDERDMLIRNFLETGAKKGEPTFYLTIDPSIASFLPQEFPSNFYLFVCNPQAETVVKSSLNVFLLKGVVNLTNINIALTLAIRKLGPSQKTPRRICISLVSDVLLQHGPVQTRQWLTELLTQLRSAGFTTLAVIDPQMHQLEQLHAILGLFEGEVNIREGETDKDLARFLKIKRMSSQKYLKEETRLAS